MKPDTISALPGHGGSRPGAGRPSLPAGKKRKMVSIKVLPSADDNWASLAKVSGVSKGGVVEWLVKAKEAKGCRDALRKYARHFLHPEE